MSTAGFSILPREIVIEIFRFCLPRAPYHRPDPHEAPILLTHVCSSWRTLASQVPELWERISLSERRQNSDSSPIIHSLATLKQRLLDQLALWKSNARHHPLDIFIKLHSAPSAPILNQREEETFPGSVRPRGFWDTVLARAIVENPQRLRKLYLKVRWPDMGIPIYTLPSTSFSNLESLQLFTDEFLPWPPEITNVTSFLHAPNLRRVTLQTSLPRQINVALPWAQLTHLTLLSPPKPSSFFSFVAAECPTLQSLSLNLEDQFAPSNYPEQKIIMANLRKLSLTMDGVVNLNFLTSTTFFCLNKVRICSNMFQAHSQLQWTQSFPDDHKHFINQLCFLHSLTLGFQNISCDSLLEILCQTPLLVELVVDSELRAYPKFLETLTYNPKEGFGSLLVPKLETFSLYVEIGDLDDNVSFTHESFFNMITSRSNIVVHPTQNNREDRPNQPARLKNVFLCIEKVKDPGRQIIDLEDLASRVEHFIELDSGTLLTLDVSSDKVTWLQEEVPIW